MQIVANKEEISKRGIQIIELSGEYGQKIKEIKNLSEKIKECWRGQDADTYVMMMAEKCIPALEQVNKVIENFGNYLKQIPKIYDTLETEAISSGEGE